MSTLKPGKDELEILSKFLIDVAKGILGVPLIIYFIKDSSLLVLLGLFMLDLFVVLLLLMIAIILRRKAKRK